MYAIIKLGNRTFEVDSGQSLGQVLQAIDIDIESVLAIRNGTAINSNEIIHPSDKIYLVHIISGGGH